jgi:hypothetical protein
MFSLKKLKVYDRPSGRRRQSAQLSAGWNKRQAVVDQLFRACETKSSGTPLYTAQESAILELLLNCNLTSSPVPCNFSS